MKALFERYEVVHAIPKDTPNKLCFVGGAFYAISRSVFSIRIFLALLSNIK